MTQPARVFLLASTIAAFAFLLIAGGQRALDTRRLGQSQALLVGRAAAWKAAQALPEDDGEARVQPFLEALVQGGAVEEVFVLRGNQFWAHGAGERAKTRLDPESIVDKETFDRAQELKQSGKRNREERESNPALTKNAYAELRFDALESGAQRVSVPVRVDDEQKAMLEATLRPPAIPVALPWAVLLVALVLTGVFGLGARALRGKRAAAAFGLILFAASVAGQAWFVHEWHGRVRLASARLEAEALARVAAAGLLEGEAEGDPLPALSRDELEAPVKSWTRLSRWSEVGSAASLGFIAPDQLTPVGLAQTLTQLQRFVGSGYIVELDRARLDDGRRDDARHLAQWGGAIFVLGALGFALAIFGQLARARASLSAHRSAYLYLSPAFVGLLVLVFVPVSFGILIGFVQKRYDAYEFAGLENYLAILTRTAFLDPNGFYFKFGVTVLWTASNVALHVGIGLFLALLLNDQMLKAKGLYRVLLIVPWAIPNYITALIWKGMFHRQYGAVNAFLQAMGFEPVSWFQTFWLAFSTNLSTNTWLGFPFMMVTSLGALQSIPSDLYEAAVVDGASRWQRFKSITLPLLMPALVPAVIVGSVWTFNMFNVIYLVSGGAPNGETDILIVDAFRWAFERNNYGYAAAYSTLIFLILILFSLATNKLTGATKGAFE